MLGMTRWTPWTEVAGVHRDLDSLFNRVFGDTVRSQSQSVDVFTPAADVRRDGDAWRVSLALPGISPDKVDIEVVGQTLRVRGERRAEEVTEALVSEITYGRFERVYASWRNRREARSGDVSPRDAGTLPAACRRREAASD